MKANVLRWIAIRSSLLILVALGEASQIEGARPLPTAPSAVVPFTELSPGGVPDFVAARTREFLAFNAGTAEFGAHSPLAVRPIYCHGVDGIAYFEVWLTVDGHTPEGWLMLSASDRDYPLVSFSHQGTPYTISLEREADRQGLAIEAQDRFLRFGVSFISLESASGEFRASYGQMPTSLPSGIDEGGEGEDLGTKVSDRSAPDRTNPLERLGSVPVENYQHLTEIFAPSYFTIGRAQQAAAMRAEVFPSEGHGDLFASGDANYIYTWIDRSPDVPYYLQIPAHTGANWTDCASGCNNNAWMGIFGWWDRARGKSNLIATTAGGEGCPLYNNTPDRRAVVDTPQMVQGLLSGTYCSGGSGWTYWSNANLASVYAAFRGYGYYRYYAWGSGSFWQNQMRQLAISSITGSRTPLHLGANAHFYIGTGIAVWNTNSSWTWVYGYPGWSPNHSDDVWVNSDDFRSVTTLAVY